MKWALVYKLNWFLFHTQMGGYVVRSLASLKAVNAQYCQLGLMHAVKLIMQCQDGLPKGVNDSLRSQYNLTHKNYC